MESLHYFHPCADVEWSEYAEQKRGLHSQCDNEIGSAIIKVARILTELEGKDIDECKHELDRCLEYGADMNWTHPFHLNFRDTANAMDIHEVGNPSHLLFTVRLNGSTRA